jgi:hypothetical protein
MNWLTTQVDRRRIGIGRLEPLALEQRGTSLRVVPYQQLLTILSARMGDSDGRDRPLVEGGFALLEDAVIARARHELAEASWAPPPDLFTMAIDDGSGSVLYLPQDTDTGSETLQLFMFSPWEGSGLSRTTGPRLARLRGSGSFSDEYAIVETVEVVEPGACSDGPCAEWGEGCGEGCRCHRFELPTPSEGGRVYGLVCR